VRARLENRIVIGAKPRKKYSFDCAVQGKTARDGFTPDIPKSTNIADDTTGTKAGTKTDDIAGTKAVDTAGAKAVDTAGAKAVDTAGTKAVDTAGANSLPVDGLCGTL